MPQHWKRLRNKTMHHWLVLGTGKQNALASCGLMTRRTYLSDAQAPRCGSCLRLLGLK